LFRVVKAMPGTPIRIALTMGDPCGIGPELWIRILCQRHSSRSADARDREEPELTIYGDLGVFERAAERLGLTAEWHRACAAPDVAVIAVTALTAEDSDPGRPTVASGAAQVAYLEAAIAAAVRGELDGICTAPIHKAWAKTAGLAFPGHTELLGAHLRAAPREVMMLAGPSLRVALATTHIALRDVARVLTVPDLTNTLVTTMRSLHRDFAIPAPRLWVAGLNPHAGEDGHFGDEEGRLIEERHCWYEPNLELRARIVAGWAQFERDLADYKPPLPSLSIDE
jgi:4-hydroxythreonine-4-phosphate dehydrogenase